MTFAAFLEESLHAMRAEAPVAYGALCERLAPREVSLTVDQETVGLRFEPRRVRLERRAERPVVRVETGRDTILDLIDARSTLAGAVLADMLVVRGTLDDLLAFHDGLVAYVHGAVRAPSFPDMLGRYRARSGRRNVEGKS